MNKSQTRIRPAFSFGVLMILVACGWWISLGVPTVKEKTKAKILETRVEESSMGELLEEKASEVGGLTNIPNKFILNPFLINSKYSGISFTSRTNALGELIDIWQMPFQIKLAGPTDFIISSAGPNRKFSDMDDIVFNSVSNNFVKP